MGFVSVYMRCRVIISCTAFLFVSAGGPYSGGGGCAAVLPVGRPDEDSLVERSKRMQRGKGAMSDAFEKAFSDFLDSDAYDGVEDTLFSVARTAYAAGWKAAGGDDSRPPLSLFSQPSEQPVE